MALPSSTFINIFAIIGYAGAAIVIIGVALEGAELIVKLGKKRKVRQWVGKRINGPSRKEFVALIAFIKPKVLPFETIGFLLLIFGLAVEWFGSGTAELLQTKENGELNRQAQEFRLKADELEQEISETSTNIANLDALKWPVHSVTADVKLRFSLIDPMIPHNVPPDLRPSLPGDLNFTGRLTISESSLPGAKVILWCGNAIQVSAMGYPTYILHFSGAFRPVPIPGVANLLPGQNAQAAGEALDTISLQISNFPATNLDVINGAVFMNVNEVLQKRIMINRGRIDDGYGILTNTPNANSSIIFLNSQ